MFFAFSMAQAFFEWTHTSFEQFLVYFDIILLGEHLQVALELLVLKIF
jgi:hypothetical protein